MNCAHHPDRPGTLAVDMPSIGVQTYLCPECIDIMCLVFAELEPHRLPHEDMRSYPTLADSSTDGRSILGEFKGEYRPQKWKDL